MKTKTILISTIAIFALVLASNAMAADPKVRVIHASPDAPAVDILVNDTIRAFENAAFGDITDFAPLAANLYNIKVVPAGAGPESAVIDADLNLTWFTKYTVLAVNNVAEIEPLVIADNTPQIVFPERAWLRFVHASPDAPAVDLRVAGGPYLFQNVSFKDVADYIQIPAGATVDVEVLIAGTESVVLVVPGVTLAEGKAYTAYAIGLAGGEPSLSALLSEDGGTPYPIRIGTGNGGGEGEERDDEGDDDDERGSVVFPDDEEDEADSAFSTFLQRIRNAQGRR